MFLAESDDKTIILESFEIPSVTRDPHESLLVQIGPEIPDLSEEFSIEESFGNDVARKDMDQRKSDTNLMIPEIIRVPQELITETSTSTTTSSTTSTTRSTSTTTTTRYIGHLTLTRPIGLPPHTPVAQKIADQR